MTGGPAGEELCSPEYWVRHVRETVRFADGVRWLADQGVGGFLELGPDGVLSAMAVECLRDRGAGAGSGSGALGATRMPVAAAAVLKRGHAEASSLIAALAQMWVCGGPVDWAAMLRESGARRVKLPTYAFQRRRYWLQIADSTEVRQVTAGGRGEQSTLDDWRYRVEWKPVASPPAPRLAGTWLVVVPAPARDDPWAGALVRALEERGAQVARVDGLGAGHAGRGAQAGADGAGHAARGAQAGADGAGRRERGAQAGADGAGRGELARSLHEALQRLPEPAAVAGVLSLLALDEQPHPTCPSVPAGLADTVALVQALGEAEIEAPLWLATRGAVSIAPSDRLRSPIQAQVWGLGRVVGLECPSRWGGLVDLPETLDERALDLLSGALMDCGAEDQLAIRGAGVLARRLARTRAGGEVDGDGWTSPRGTVLITGGTGGLGAHVARWLARSGAEHLLLASRRGDEAPGAQELRAELVDLGAEVTIAACDVAEREQLQALLRSLPSHLPLSAVVHAAGTGRHRGDRLAHPRGPRGGVVRKGAGGAAPG